MLDRYVSLRQLATREQREVSRTIRTIGPAWTAFEETIGATMKFADVIEQSAPNTASLDQVRALAANTFFKSAGRCMALEALDLARRHVAESQNKRRRAMEFVAYAWIVWKSPSAAGAWLKGDVDWNKYQDAFKNSQIYGALKELSPQDLRPHLDAVYKHLSRTAVHASMASISQAALLFRGAGGRMLDVEYFDFGQFPSRLHRALKAELMLDSIRGIDALLRGFHSRALSRHGWQKAELALAPVLNQLDWRLRRDEEHFQSDFIKLGRHREQNLARIERQNRRRRTPPDIPAEVLQALNPTWAASGNKLPGGSVR